MFFFDNTTRCLWNEKKIPLQVHSHTVIDRNISKRTSQSASDQGFMTVEAAVVLPLLLCAFMGLLLLGKVFIASREVDTSLLEAARQLARKEYIFTMKEKEGATIYLAQNLFGRIRKQGDAAEGVEVTAFDFLQSKYLEESKELRLVVTYKIKIPTLLLGTWKISLKSAVTQKAWNGYAPLPEEKWKEDESYVYITEDGNAYHKDGQCYHLHITVKKTGNVTPYYEGKTSFRPCEYCVDGNKTKKSLYIPEDGECYHESMDCSGLTRRVRYVQETEAGNRIPCKDCCK